jgi:predicted Zn-dependent protease
MRKLIIELSCLIAGFLLLWKALTFIPWTTWLQVDKISVRTEEKLGSILMESYEQGKTRIDRDSVKIIVNELKDRLCGPNKIPESSVMIHVFEDEEINAFAFPDSQVVINSGLIRFCDNPEMLAGVIAHEIAHVQHEHVNKKLTRELGLAAVMMVTGGTQDIGVIRKILHVLSSSRFDRSQEEEADKTAVELLQRAGINPAGLAQMLRKLSLKEPTPGIFEWVSTHPEAGKRSAEILKRRKEGLHYTQALPAGKWEQLQGVVQRSK